MTELKISTAEAEARVSAEEDRQWKELAIVLSDAIDGYVKKHEAGVNVLVVQAAIGNVATASFFHMPREMRVPAVESFCDILSESIDEMNKAQ